MTRAIRWPMAVLSCCVLVLSAGCCGRNRSVESTQTAPAQEIQPDAPEQQRLSLLSSSPSPSSASATTESALIVEQTESDLAFQADVYRSHIALLAHDELKGRGTGHYGIDLAAGYIAGQFASFGLEPGGPDGTYFQEYSIAGRPELLDDTSLSFTGVDGELTLRDDYIPFGFSSHGSFSGDVAFVGYGATNADQDYDDYTDIDVEGMVVLMLRREPPTWRENGWTKHARFDSKMALAVEHGAIAVIIVNQDPGEDGDDILMPFRMRAGSDQGIPAIHLKRDAAEAVLAAAGTESLTALQEELDAGTTVSLALSGITADGKVSAKSDDILARNVIGVLPGMGRNADEYVVFGAHYDHVGVRRGQIHNGADDNASGTAGVIEIARALAQTPYRNRSVICMTFSGEEMGLKGSQYYASEPTVDIGKITAMLNLDMIGRLSGEGRNKLAIQGLGTGDNFHDLVDRHTAAMGIEFTPDESALGGSDHSSFYHAGVPSLFFFTGLHGDYHQPGDDTEKINFEGGVLVTKLAYSIGLDLINTASVPVYAEVDRPASMGRFQRGTDRPGNEVVMGIMPDWQDESDQKGWRVARVGSDGPAAAAGMKNGDRILEIEDTSINGYEDYLEATEGKKPGDVVTVKVLRGSEELTLEVKLAPR